MKKTEKIPDAKKAGRSGSKSDWNIRPYLAMGLIIFIVFCCCLFVVFLVFRFDQIKGAISGFADIAQPILYGLAIGYLMNPVMSWIERRVLQLMKSKGENPKYRKLVRTLSSIFAVLIFILVIASLLSMVIPQVVSNISNLVDTLPSQVNAFIAHMGEWRFGNDDVTAFIETYLTSIVEWLEDWLKNSILPQAKDYAASITSGVINILNVVKNIVIGLIVSIYVMCEKEQFEGQSKKIIFSVLPSRAANQVIQIFHTMNEILGGFIKGKMLDSLIIGIICYIGLSIIKMPYTLLVSVIVGVTNIIPFFGPFIGAIPCAFLILLSDPLYAMYFIIFVVILQQVDGNIIGPKILGDSTGLSSFWVMFAILVGSGLFGVMGMLLGCPVFAVIYYIVQKTVDFLLRKKSMPLGTDVYIKATGADPYSGKLWYDYYADDHAAAVRRKKPDEE